MFALYSAYWNLIPFEQYPQAQHVLRPVKSNLIEALYQIGALPLWKYLNKPPPPMAKEPFVANDINWATSEKTVDTIDALTVPYTNPTMTKEVV